MKYVLASDCGTDKIYYYTGHIDTSMGAIANFSQKSEAVVFNTKKDAEKASRLITDTYIEKL